MCVININVIRAAQPLKARARRESLLSRRKLIPIEPKIWDVQYRKLFSERPRRSNNAALKSFHSVQVEVSFSFANDQKELTPCVKPVGCEEHREEKENHRIRLQSDPKT